MSTSGHLVRTHRSSLPRSSGAYAALLLIVLTCTSACGGGSANIDAKGKADAEGEANFDVEGDAAWTEVAEDAQAGEQPTNGSSSPRPESGNPAAGGIALSGAPAGGAPLLGARHDVHLKGEKQPSCKCLAVAVGKANDAEIGWAGEAPAIDESSQLVLALDSSGVACDVQAPAASYMGYEHRGADVVVNIEGATEGRPITRGAILPMPPSGGKIRLQGHGKIPYGKGLKGEGTCVVYP